MPQDIDWPFFDRLRPDATLRVGDVITLTPRVNPLEVLTSQHTGIEDWNLNGVVVRAFCVNGYDGRTVDEVRDYFIPPRPREVMIAWRLCDDAPARLRKRYIDTLDNVVEAEDNADVDDDEDDNRYLLRAPEPELGPEYKPGRYRGWTTAIKPTDRLRVGDVVAAWYTNPSSVFSNLKVDPSSRDAYRGIEVAFCVVPHAGMLKMDLLRVMPHGTCVWRRTSNIDDEVIKSLKAKYKKWSDVDGEVVKKPKAPIIRMNALHSRAHPFFTR